MEVTERQTMGSRAVGADKQRQEMLHEFDHQIAQPLFVSICKPGSGIGQGMREFVAAETDVCSIIGQTNVAGVGSTTRLLMMMPASFSLPNPLN